MAYKILSSFSGGELDPALRERTTLDKYRTGLSRARNVYINKTGRVSNRGGSDFIVKTKDSSNRKSILYSPANLGGMLIEFGHLYARAYDMNDEASIASPEEYTHNITENDLKNVHFTCLISSLPTVGPVGLVFVFLDGQEVLKLSLATSGYNITTDLALCDRYTGPTLSAASGSGTGIAVEYAITQVVNGIESEPYILTNPVEASAPKLPILVSEKTTINMVVNHVVFPPSTVSEMRVYRRPWHGGAYGYIGSSFELEGGPFPTDYEMTFVDHGVEADYAHSPPDYLPDFEDDTDEVALTTDGRSIDAKTGIIFQRRLITAGGKNKEAIHAGRIIPRLFNFLDFTRDFPLNDACALTFKCGSDGGSFVKRFLDVGSLVAFTQAGVFANQKGALTPDNITMIKQADYVIDDLVPPLAVPGGVFFVDAKTNSIVLIRASEEYASFLGEEISVFSNHLFENKRVVSWTFWGGKIPVVAAVMDDGTMNTFSYERDQQMRAWTWHDTDGDFESVATYKDSDGFDQLAVIVNRTNGRYIERINDRYFDDIKDAFFVDSGVRFKNILNDATPTRGVITIAPVVAEDYEGEFKITSNQATFTVAGGGATGSVYRVFDRNGSAYTFDLVSRASDNVITVQIRSGAFDPTISTIDDLYLCYRTLTGLSHLNGKSVSILADGYVVASPMNSESQFDDIVVESGECTLPNDYAIVNVGLPYNSDIETLDVDTVEQSPTLLESKICNVVYIKNFKSRGGYASGRFPQDADTVQELETNTGMSSIENYYHQYHYNQSDDLLGNRTKLPDTRRAEVVIQSDWQSNGRICIRQCDPLPLEILSIIPDLDIEKRG